MREMHGKSQTACAISLTWLSFLNMAVSLLVKPPKQDLMQYIFLSTKSQEMLSYLN